MRPTPYYPFHGHLLPSVSNGSIPSLSVSSAFVASQILFGPSGLLLARAIIRSEKILRSPCTSHHQMCKDCARLQGLCMEVLSPCTSHHKMCKGCARLQGLCKELCSPCTSHLHQQFSGFSQSRSLSCTVVKRSRQKFNEHPVVGPSMKKFNVECV